MSDINFNIYNQGVDINSLSLSDKRKSEKFEDAAAIAMFGFNLSANNNSNTILA